MEQLLNSYYENNAKKLHNVVNQIFNKHYGGTTGRDMDEFYGVGSDVLIDILEKYKHGKNTYDSSKGNFDGYVYRAISMAITDEFKRQNRDKRTSKVFLLDDNGNKVLDEQTGKPIKISLPDIRLDAPINEDSNITQMDMLQSDFSISDTTQDNIYNDEKIQIFLNTLPDLQRKIIEMKIDDFSADEIKETLGLSNVEYSKNIKSIETNENWSMFNKNVNDGDYQKEEIEMQEAIMNIDDVNNYRMDKSSLFSLLEDKKNGEINCKYILQRKPFQWTPEEVNRYIARILNNLPIPEIIICEQKIKDMTVSHLIDGLQRLSYAEAFKENRIKIGEKGAERRYVQYKEYKVDVNGNRELDENGYPIFEIKVCDIVGKKYKNLPDDLKKRFNKFNINVTRFFQCTDQQIADHIRDYNNHASMNQEQGGITKISTDTATKIKTIAEKNKFFLNCGKFTSANRIKGKLDRVVAESLMLIFFRNSWKAKLDNIYQYVNDNVTDEQFTKLNSNLSRLSKILSNDKQINSMFTVTTSPMWIAVFDEFTKFGLDDIKFYDFLKEYANSLKDREVDGISMSDFKNDQTKKKATITGKIELLVKLMSEYLHINKEELNKPICTEEFIAENLDMDVDTIQDDMNFYNDSLNELLENTVKVDSKLRNDENRLSLLTMMVYSYKEDRDLDDWMVEYARKNNTYFVDQQKNFLHMKQNFEQYCKEHKLSA